MNSTLIEEVSQYKYLGSIIDTKNNSNIQQDYTITNANRAVFKVLSLLKPLGQIPPILAAHLFDSMVRPILEYGIEIWGANSKLDSFDVFERNFLRSILKVRSQTANLAVYGDLGRIPISYKIHEKILKYYVRINSFPETSLLKKCLHYSKELHELGYLTWYSRIQVLLNKYKLDDDIHDRSLEGKGPTSTQIKNNIKKKLLNSYVAVWKSELENCTGKLRTYRIFKTDFGIEPFLKLTEQKFRIAISRFRSSSHNLEIERGRFTRPPVPSDQRFCRLCKNGSVDNEQHALLSCTSAEPSRDILIRKAKELSPNFDTLTLNDKMIFLLQSKDSKLQILLAKHLLAIDKSRIENSSIA